MENRQEMSLHSTIFDEGSVRIVEISGDLVAEETENLRAILEDLIADGCYRVVLDLSRVDFMCSFTLGVLVTMLKKTREQGGDMKLAGLNSWLRNLLKIAQVAKIVDIYDSPTEAVKAFAVRS